MKNILSILLIGLGTLFFTACSDSDETAPPVPVEVNMIGTWEYHISTQNSDCDGLAVEGLQTTESLDGDMTTMGNTHFRGTNLELDSCDIVPIDKISTLGRGFPSVMTQDEYLAYLEHFHHTDSDIGPIRVDIYNNAEIVLVFELSDGAQMTTRLTRVL